MTRRKWALALELFHIALAFAWAGTHATFWFLHPAGAAAFSGIVLSTQAIIGGCPLTIFERLLRGRDPLGGLWFRSMPWWLGFPLRGVWMCVAVANLVEAFR